jgi:poly-gamma-glutamate capsule biosynthesis protein CapA/YwtB (metallophosphatase superfamily)
MNKSEDVVFYAAGDIAPWRDDPVTIFRHVKPVLQEGDLAFCQLEASVSDRGVRTPQATAIFDGNNKPFTHQDVRYAPAIKDAGFDVVSFAGNHCLDLGYDALFDTIGAIKKLGMHIIGVGANLEEARKPAILERKDARVAFLAYNSILPTNYWALSNRPGCAPLRATTVYEPVEPAQPGRPGRVSTYPHRGDLQAMIDDVEGTKAKADLVIVSQHCGIHFVPAVLADYQKDLAHAAIDAGADLVLQHHSHILKGIEVYKGKVIFYSLANFAIELPVPRDVNKVPPSLADAAKWETHPEYLPHVMWDPLCPTFPFHPEARKTLMVKCVIANKQIKRVSFLPVYINNKAEPEVLNPQDPMFGEIVAYMENITGSQGLKTRYTVEGNEVVIKKE